MNGQQKSKQRIGPASRDATKALQGVTDDIGNNLNDSLQATRKQVKLDQLDQ